MKYVVAEASEIEPGERRMVTVAGRSIGVFNVGGEFFALRNRCPHQGGRLCEGVLWGVLRSDRPGDFDHSPSREILACPWHGWEFSVRTGESWCAPERLRVRRYDVETVAGEEIAASDGSDGEAAGSITASDGGAAAASTAEANAASDNASRDERGGEALVVSDAAALGDPDAPAPGLVRGPYVAETYPVSRDGEYLVVEIPSAPKQGSGGG